MSVASAYRRLRPSVAKAEGMSPEEEQALEAISAAISFDAWEALVPDVEEALRVAYAQSGIDAYYEIEAEVSTLFDQVNEAAAAYAQTRSAEMVGMSYVGGQLVPNPNAEWTITETTREGLRELVSNAFAEGWSPAELSNQIRDSGIFGKVRAELIASTEMSMAQSEATLSAWKQSGLVLRKRSVLSADHTGEDECDDAAEQDFIPVGEDFVTGDDAPPFHPRCRCSLEAELTEESRALSQ